MSADDIMTPVVTAEEVKLEEEKVAETPAATEQAKPASTRRGFFSCFAGCRRAEATELPAEKQEATVEADKDKEATAEGETEKDNVAVGVPPVEAVASVEAA